MYTVIDGGTSNTRIYTVEQSQVTKVAHAAVGAGNPTGLATFIKETLAALPTTAAVIASGMITSASGLYELPHLKAPAGIGDLHRGMKQISLPEISRQPFFLIPGVRTDDDMMRGEETELAGLTQTLVPDAAYILPGTHSKCILIGRDGKITDFFTMLTGELLSAVKTATIIGQSFEFCETYIEEYLLQGFEYCRLHGINETLFRCRTLSLLQGRSKQEVYSFCLGAVLCPEVERIRKIAPSQLFIGGKAVLRLPETLLLQRYSEKLVYSLSENACRNAVAIGAVRIYTGAAAMQTTTASTAR